MSISNAETTAKQSFEYISQRALNADFLSAFSNEFGKIEDTHGFLDSLRGVALFLKNLLELGDKEHVSYNNEFWVSHENDVGIHRIILTLQSDIDSFSESLEDVDTCLINIGKARHDLKLAYEQLDLVSALIYQKELNHDNSSLRSISSYVSIFQNIHSVTNRLYSEFTILNEAAKQISDSAREVLEGTT